MTAKITLSDVAKLAGVSPITASRALRNPEKVSEKKLKLVQDAAKTLNYEPDLFARALATGKTNVIGVLIPSVTNAVFSEVVAGAYEAIEGTGYTLQFANTRYSAEKEAESIKLFLNQRVAGLIIAGIDQNSESKQLLKSADIPIVQVMDISDDPYGVIVGFSNYDAAHSVAEHLANQGYTKLGFLGARLDPRTMRRFEGFKAGAQKVTGFDEARAILTKEASSTALGARLLRELMQAKPDTDAIFCNNDDLALGALFEAQRLGIDIPEQLGICGFNDLETMSIANPSITSVKTKRRDIGAAAIKIVTEFEDQMKLGGKVRDFGFEIIGRQSTDKTGILH